MSFQFYPSTVAHAWVLIIDIVRYSHPVPRSTIRVLKPKSMQPLYILEPLSRGLCEILVPTVGLAKVGRSEDNEFSLPDDLQMSSVHFEIGADSGGCRIRDMGSSNGIFLNTKRVASAIVVEGDEIQAGSSRWRLVVHEDNRPATTPPTHASQIAVHATGPLAVSADELISNPRESASYSGVLQLKTSNGISRSLNGTQSVTIGRTPSAQWVFEEDGQMSSCHLELSHRANAWHLTDLNSTNGTFVNGSRVREAQLFSGDEIRAGQTRFTVTILEAATQQPERVASEPALVDDSQPQLQPQEIGDEQDAPSSDVSCVEELPQESDAIAPVDAPVEEIASAATGESPPSDSLRQSTLVANPEEASSGEVDWDDSTAYARRATEVAAVAVPSGLFVFRGDAAPLEPVDVCLRILQATGGWVLNGSEIESWIGAASQGLTGLPREWLNPAGADDASWMLPFLGTWGTGNAWLLLASGELEEALQSLRQSDEGQLPLLASLNRTALINFLTQGDSHQVQKFFAPLDAILLEVGAGQRWAVFGRIELEAILHSSGL